MILTFSKPEFEQLIKDEIKIHTIRKDAGNRWKVGMKIHFWMGNPRNVKRNPKPYSFATGTVYRIEPIEIYPDENCVVIGGVEFTSFSALNHIAINDGFESWAKMKKFFSENFTGRLIFWKDLEIL
jgi:hypothetical protein